ncbi:phosphonate C-P lyase system protein PhnH [uncultured Enterovirga sp.]|uniref:phosphonate C-P lyase system protein PhnH n=1 Tax=uncultured Enterovirga sp. TaxID=2026352 RepID=UPI0035CA61F6
MSAALAPGFADPVFEAQAVFRTLLDALARPGVRQPLPAALEPPAPLTQELAAVALALADPDGSLWLDAPLARDPAVAGYLRFHTGARIVTDPTDAAFALVNAPDVLPSFSRFANGTDEYPDRSTTLVIAVPALDGGPPIRLAGPGIPHEVVVSAALPAGFAARLRANHGLFPRGVDCLLVSRGEAIGIPRSSTILGAA